MPAHVAELHLVAFGRCGIVSHRAPLEHLHQQQLTRQHSGPHPQAVAQAGTTVLSCLDGQIAALTTQIEAEIDRIPGCTGFGTEDMSRTFHQQTQDARNILRSLKAALGGDLDVPEGD